MWTSVQVCLSVLMTQQLTFPRASELSPGHTLSLMPYNIRATDHPGFNAENNMQTRVWRPGDDGH